MPARWAGSTPAGTASSAWRCAARSSAPTTPAAPGCSPAAASSRAPTRPPSWPRRRRSSPPSRPPSRAEPVASSRLPGPRRAFYPRCRSPVRAGRFKHQLVPVDSVPVSATSPLAPAGVRVLVTAGRGVLGGVALALLATAGLAPRSVLGGAAAVLFAVGAAAVAWTGVRRRALRRGEIPWTSLALTAAVLADVAQAVEWGTAAPAGASLADVLRLAAYGLLATMSLRGTVGGRRRHG